MVSFYTLGAAMIYMHLCRISAAAVLNSVRNSSLVGPNYMQWRRW
jgi:hypothetical protein